MKIQKTTIGKESKVTFFPETEEEKLIMGSLRNHYFFGTRDSGTFPKYAGITTKDNFVTSMSFEYKNFE